MFVKPKLQKFPIGHLFGTCMQADDCQEDKYVFAVASDVQGGKITVNIGGTVFYRAWKQLRDLTTQDLGYSEKNKIYLAESLTERNRMLFKDCLKV